jgi:hypothetical protein
MALSNALEGFPRARRESEGRGSVPGSSSTELSTGLVCMIVNRMTYHGVDRGRGIGVANPHARVHPSEHPEDLIRKSLAYGVHALEIERDLRELFQPNHCQVIVNQSKKPIVN